MKFIAYIPNCELRKEEFEKWASELDIYKPIKKPSREMQELLDFIERDMDASL